MYKKLIAVLISAVFLIEQTGYAQVAPQLGVPQYLQGLVAADKFRPMHLRSVSFATEKDSLQVLLERGDEKKVKQAQAEETTRKLLEYFRVGLALPNSTFWVNLRPDAADSIIDPLLEKTDVGKVLLEADLQLKKDMAALTSPNTPQGRQYWNKLYERAESLFAGQEAEIPTYNRPWIVPGEIILGVGQNNSAFVYKATLMVLLESDALAGSSAAGQQALKGPTVSFDDPRLKELNEYSAQLIKQLILPTLTRQINSSRKYANLRQVYYSLILSQWFKQRYSQATNPSSSFISSIDTKNISQLSSKASWSKDTYFKAYQKSFQQGEYSKEETVSSPNGLTVRRYFSGGFKMPELFVQSRAAAALPNVTIVPFTRTMITGMQAVLSSQGDVTITSPQVNVNADGGFEIKVNGRAHAKFLGGMALTIFGIIHGLNFWSYSSGLTGPLMVLGWPLAIGSLAGGFYLLKTMGSLYDFEIDGKLLKDGGSIAGDPIAGNPYVGILLKLATGGMITGGSAVSAWPLLSFANHIGGQEAAITVAALLVFTGLIGILQMKDAVSRLKIIEQLGEEKDGGAWRLFVPQWSATKQEKIELLKKRFALFPLLTITSGLLASAITDPEFLNSIDNVEKFVLFSIVVGGAIAFEYGVVELVPVLLEKTTKDGGSIGSKVKGLTLAATGAALIGVAGLYSANPYAYIPAIIGTLSLFGGALMLIDNGRDGGKVQKLFADMQSQLVSIAKREENIRTIEKSSVPEDRAEREIQVNIKKVDYGMLGKDALELRHLLPEAAAKTALQVARTAWNLFDREEEVEKLRQKESVGAVDHAYERAAQARDADHAKLEALMRELEKDLLPFFDTKDGGKLDPANVKYVKMSGDELTSLATIRDLFKLSKEQLFILHMIERDKIRAYESRLIKSFVLVCGELLSMLAVPPLYSAAAIVVTFPFVAYYKYKGTASDRKATLYRDIMNAQRGGIDPDLFYAQHPRDGGKVKDAQKEYLERSIRLEVNEQKEANIYRSRVRLFKQQKIDLMDITFGDEQPDGSSALRQKLIDENAALLAKAKADLKMTEERIVKLWKDRYASKEKDGGYSLNVLDLAAASDAVLTHFIEQEFDADYAQQAILFEQYRRSIAIFVNTALQSFGPGTRVTSYTVREELKSRLGTEHALELITRADKLQRYLDELLTLGFDLKSLKAQVAPGALEQVIGRMYPDMSADTAKKLSVIYRDSLEQFVEKASASGLSGIEALFAGASNAQQLGRIIALQRELTRDGGEQNTVSMVFDSDYWLATSENAYYLRTALWNAATYNVPVKVGTADGTVRTCRIDYDRKEALVNDLEDGDLQVKTFDGQPLRLVLKGMVSGVPQRTVERLVLEDVDPWFDKFTHINTTKLGSNFDELQVLDQIGALDAELAKTQQYFEKAAIVLAECDTLQEREPLEYILRASFKRDLIRMSNDELVKLFAQARDVDQPGEYKLDMFRELAKRIDDGSLGNAQSSMTIEKSLGLIDDPALDAGMKRKLVDIWKAIGVKGTVKGILAKSRIASPSWPEVLAYMDQDPGGDGLAGVAQEKKSFFQRIKDAYTLPLRNAPEKLKADKKLPAIDLRVETRRASGRPLELAIDLSANYSDARPRGRSSLRVNEQGQIELLTGVAVDYQDALGRGDLAGRVLTFDPADGSVLKENQLKLASQDFDSWFEQHDKLVIGKREGRLGPFKETYLKKGDEFSFRDNNTGHQWVLHMPKDFDFKKIGEWHLIDYTPYFTGLWVKYNRREGAAVHLDSMTSQFHELRELDNGDLLLCLSNEIRRINRATGQTRWTLPFPQANGKLVVESFVFDKDGNPWILFFNGPLLKYNINADGGSSVVARTPEQTDALMRQWKAEVLSFEQRFENLSLTDEQKKTLGADAAKNYVVGQDEQGKAYLTPLEKELIGAADPYTLEKLASVLGNDNEDTVLRYHSAFLLGQTKSKQALKYLQQQLNRTEGDPGVVFFVRNAIMKLRNPKLENTPFLDVIRLDELAVGKDDVRELIVFIDEHRNLSADDIAAILTARGKANLLSKEVVAKAGGILILQRPVFSAVSLKPLYLTAAGLGGWAVYLLTGNVVADVAAQALIWGGFAWTVYNMIKRRSGPGGQSSSNLRSLEIVADLLKKIETAEGRNKKDGGRLSLPLRVLWGRLTGVDHNLIATAVYKPFFQKERIAELFKEIGGNQYELAVKMYIAGLHRETDTAAGCAEMLGYLGDERAIDGLAVAATHDRSQSNRSEALAALVRIDTEKSVTAALQVIMQGDVQNQLDLDAYFWSLGRAKPASVAARSYRDFLEGKKWGTKVRIAEVVAAAAGFIRAEGIKDVLIDLTKDESVSVRIGAVHGLRELHDPSVVPALTEALKDAELSVRAHSATALGIYRDPYAVDGLIDAARARDRVFKNYIWALGRIASDKVYSYLLEELAKGPSGSAFENELDFASVIQSLGALGRKPAAQEIRPFFETADDGPIKDAAILALAELGETDVEHDLRALKYRIGGYQVLGAELQDFYYRVEGALELFDGDMDGGLKKLLRDERGFMRDRPLGLLDIKVDYIGTAYGLPYKDNDLAEIGKVPLSGLIAITTKPRVARNKRLFAIMLIGEKGGFGVLPGLVWALAVNGLDKQVRAGILKAMKRIIQRKTGRGASSLDNSSIENNSWIRERIDDLFKKEDYARLHDLLNAAYRRAEPVDRKKHSLDKVFKGLDKWTLVFVGDKPYFYLGHTSEGTIVKLTGVNLDYSIIEYTDYLKGKESTLPVSEEVLIGKLSYKKDDTYIRVYRDGGSKAFKPESYQLPRKQLPVEQFEAALKEQLNRLAQAKTAQDIDAARLAVEELGKLGDDRAVQPLIDAYQRSWPDSYTTRGDVSYYDHGDVLLYTEIARALGRIGSKEAVDFLKPLARQGGRGAWSWISTAAAKALGESGSSDAVSALIDLLEGNSWFSKPYAAEALGKMKAADPRAVDALIKALDQSSYPKMPGLVPPAAWALGEIGDRKALLPLVWTVVTNLFDDEVRTTAWEAIAKIHRADKDGGKAFARIVEKASDGSLLVLIGSFGLLYAMPLAFQTAMFGWWGDVVGSVVAGSSTMSVIGGLFYLYDAAKLVKQEMFGNKDGGVLIYDFNRSFQDIRDGRDLLKDAKRRQVAYAKIHDGMLSMGWVMLDQQKALDPGWVETMKSAIARTWAAMQEEDTPVLQDALAGINAAMMLLIANDLQARVNHDPQMRKFFNLREYSAAIDSIIRYLSLRWNITPNVTDKAVRDRQELKPSDLLAIFTLLGGNRLKVTVDAVGRDWRGNRSVRTLKFAVAGRQETIKDGGSIIKSRTALKGLAAASIASILGTIIYYGHQAIPAEVLGIAACVGFLFMMVYVFIIREFREDGMEGPPQVRFSSDRKDEENKDGGSQLSDELLEALRFDLEFMLAFHDVDILDDLGTLTAEEFEQALRQREGSQVVFDAFKCSSKPVRYEDAFAMAKSGNYVVHVYRADPIIESDKMYVLYPTDAEYGRLLAAEEAAKKDGGNKASEKTFSLSDLKRLLLSLEQELAIMPDRSDHSSETRIIAIAKLTGEVYETYGKILDAVGAVENAVPVSNKQQRQEMITARSMVAYIGKLLLDLSKERMELETEKLANPVSLRLGEKELDEVRQLIAVYRTALFDSLDEIDRIGKGEEVFLGTTTAELFPSVAAMIRDQIKDFERSIARMQEDMILVAPEKRGIYEKLIRRAQGEIDKRQRILAGNRPEAGRDGGTSSENDLRTQVEDLRSKAPVKLDTNSVRNLKKTIKRILSEGGSRYLQIKLESFSLKRGDILILIPREDYSWNAFPRVDNARIVLVDTHFGGSEINGLDIPLRSETMADSEHFTAFPGDYTFLVLPADRGIRDGGDKAGSAEELQVVRRRLTQSDERTVLYQLLIKAAREKDAEALMTLRARSPVLAQPSDLDSLQQGDMVFFNKENIFYYYISRQGNLFEFETYPTRTRVPMAVNLDGDITMHMIPLGRAAADMQARDGGSAEARRGAEPMSDGGDSTKAQLIGDLSVLTQEMLEKWATGEPDLRTREIIINKFHYLLKMTGAEKDAVAITADDHPVFNQGDLIFFKDSNGDNYGVVISYADGKLTYYRVFSHPIPIDSHLRMTENAPLEGFTNLRYLALPSPRVEDYTYEIKELEKAKAKIDKDNPVIKPAAAKEELRRINARIAELQWKMRGNRDGGGISIERISADLKGFVGESSLLAEVNATGIPYLELANKMRDFLRDLRKNKQLVFPPVVKIARMGKDGIVFEVYFAEFPGVILSIKTDATTEDPKVNEVGVNTEILTGDEGLANADGGRMKLQENLAALAKAAAELKHQEVIASEHQEHVSILDEAHVLIGQQADAQNIDMQKWLDTMAIYATSDMNEECVYTAIFILVQLGEIVYSGREDDAQAHKTLRFILDTLTGIVGRGRNEGIRQAALRAHTRLDVLAKSLQNKDGGSASAYTAFISDVFGPVLVKVSEGQMVSEAERMRVLSEAQKLDPRLAMGIASILPQWAGGPSEYDPMMLELACDVFQENGFYMLFSQQLKPQATWPANAVLGKIIGEKTRFSNRPGGQEGIKVLTVKRLVSTVTNMFYRGTTDMQGNVIIYDLSGDDPVFTSTRKSLTDLRKRNTRASFDGFSPWDKLVLRQWKDATDDEIRKDLQDSIEIHEVMHGFDLLEKRGYSRKDMEVSALLTVLAAGPAPYYELADIVYEPKNVPVSEERAEILEAFIEKISGKAIKHSDPQSAEYRLQIAGLDEADIRRFAREIYKQKFKETMVEGFLLTGGMGADRKKDGGQEAAGETNEIHVLRSGSPGYRDAALNEYWGDRGIISVSIRGKENSVRYMNRKTLGSSAATFAVMLTDDNWEELEAMLKSIGQLDSLKAGLPFVSEDNQQIEDMHSNLPKFIVLENTIVFYSEASKDAALELAKLIHEQDPGSRLLAENNNKDGGNRYSLRKEFDLSSRGVVRSMRLLGNDVEVLSDVRMEKTAEQSVLKSVLGRGETLQRRARTTRFDQEGRVWEEARDIVFTDEVQQEWDDQECLLGGDPFKRVPTFAVSSYLNKMGTVSLTDSQIEQYQETYTVPYLGGDKAVWKLQVVAGELTDALLVTEERFTYRLVMVDPSGVEKVIHDERRGEKLIGIKNLELGYRSGILVVLAHQLKFLDEGTGNLLWELPYTVNLNTLIDSIIEDQAGNIWVLSGDQLQMFSVSDPQTKLDDFSAEDRDGGVGGIDLRALPLNAVPMNPAQVVPALISGVPVADLDKEWAQIVKQMQSGPMPYDKLKAHVQQCCGRQEAARHLQEVSACVMKILELEEDAAVATSVELKDVLCCLS